MAVSIKTGGRRAGHGSIWAYLCGMMPVQELIADKEIRDAFRVARLADAGRETMPLIHVLYNRIFLVSEGNGTIRVDDKDHTLSGNEVFLVAKGQTFRFSAGASLKGIEISFGDCFWERSPASAANCKAILFHHAALNQRLVLDTPAMSGLNAVCNTLLLEYLDHDYPNKLDVLAAYLKVIMIKLANAGPAVVPATDSFDDKLYRQFLERVSTGYNRTHEVAGFARELAVSTRKLSDLCRRKSGHGAKEIINGHLVAEAKRSLQFSTRPVKQIAYDLSFATPEQFSHFFKKNTGIGPAGYRRLFVNIDR